MGRPLWTSETGKLSPGPDVYEKKSHFQILDEQAKKKPNKCLFGESTDKYRRVSVIV